MQTKPLLYKRELCQVNTVFSHSTSIPNYPQLDLFNSHVFQFVLVALITLNCIFVSFLHGRLPLLASFTDER